MSTTERDKCGLTSLIPMSCRDRAETFARHLHSRLRSLGSEDGGSSADENSWLAAHEVPVAVSHQPRHSSDSELYFDFGLLESPGSPVEEVTDAVFPLINTKDNLELTRCENCSCPKNPTFTNSNVIIANSHDSDSSDGPYYDTETDSHQKVAYVNGIADLPEDDEHGEHDTGQPCEAVENHVLESPSSEKPVEEPAEESAENHLNDSMYESPLASEYVAPPQYCTDDESTLSLRDEDYPSLEYSSTLQEFPQLENHEEEPKAQSEEPKCSSDEQQEDEVYSSSLNVEKDLIVECPLTGVLITKCDTLEKDDSPKESRAFLEVGKDADDLDEDKEERIPRVRRCSSLKTGKTPPGTPGRKKIVRFADVLGLDLADVRTFLDEIPKIPTSAYDDLTDTELISASGSDFSLSSSSTDKFHPCAGHKAEKILLPLFQQPGGQPNFLDKVRERNVCLENAVVSDPVDLAIKGTVRVRNLDFHKSVHIRYSLDLWKTYADLQATYLANSCDGFSDTFSFLLYAHTLTVGQRLEFAVRFHCKGSQFWDNNHGANYCFQCLPASNVNYLTNGTFDEHWGASFYYQDSENVDSADEEVVLHSGNTQSRDPQKRRLRQVPKMRAVRRRKADLVTVFVILVISVFFMYLQSNIF